MAVFAGSAPGKAILFGEHAVVHGASCVAASIDLRTSATVELKGAQAREGQPIHSGNEVVLTLQGLNLEWRWHLEKLEAIVQNLEGPSSAISVVDATEVLTSKLRDLAKAATSMETSSSLIAGAAAFLFLHIHILGLCPSHTVLRSELPMGAGLGSSAAYCVSIAGAMLAAISAPGFTRPVSPKRGGQRPQNGPEHSIPPETVGAFGSGSDVLSDGPLVPNQLESTACLLQRPEADVVRGTSCSVFPQCTCGLEERGGCCRPHSSESSHLESSVLESEAASNSLQGVDLANAWAFQAERIIHGRPSGVDNTVSCFGGAICFKKGVITRLPNMLSLRMLLTNTNVGRDTKALVAGVGQRAARFPAVYEPLFTSIDGISQAFLRTSADDASSPETVQVRVEELVDLNQAILRGIGVSHPKIEEIVAITAARKLHSKLTGAGGGGCVLTLLQDLDEQSVRQLVTELESHGFKCFQVTVGGPGLQWTAGAS